MDENLVDVWHESPNSNPSQYPLFFFPFPTGSRVIIANEKYISQYHSKKCVINGHKEQSLDKASGKSFCSFGLLPGMQMCWLQL
jgi:hypothetical protein